jgi:hypothetical protein
MAPMWLLLSSFARLGTYTFPSNVVAGLIAMSGSHTQYYDEDRSRLQFACTYQIIVHIIGVVSQLHYANRIKQS